MRDARVVYVVMRDEVDVDQDVEHLEVREFAIGKDFGPFPPLRPMTTSLHSSPSEPSWSLEDWPGNSLRSESWFSESQASTAGCASGFAEIWMKRVLRQSFGTY